MSMDRRHEPRVRAVTLVDVGEFTEVGLLERLTIGRTLDVSEDGLRLELNHPLAVGARLTLDLELGERILEVWGTVRSTRPGATDGTWVLGVELEGLAPEAYEVFHEFVELHTNGAGA